MLFLQEDMINYLPLMGTKAGAGLHRVESGQEQEQPGWALSSSGAATEWHCSQRPCAQQGAHGTKSGFSQFCSPQHQSPPGDPH